MLRAQLQLPNDIVELIAGRAAELVLERLELRATAPESAFLTVNEAAELLRAKRQRIYDLLSDGRLARHKDGARVLVRRADLVAHLLPRGSPSRMTRTIAA